tara:strand:+ start:862 stop:1281 length:420 start_codon:yes stop_codon:yes gene_type:complete
MYKKSIFFVLNVFIFSIIYFLIDDSHFSGINKIDEALREEIIKRNVSSEIKENLEIDVDVVDNKNEKILEKETIEVKKEVAQQELKTIKSSSIQKIFDRIYFSFVTGSTLGYGDIYPRTNYCKVIVIIQLLISIKIVFL